MPTITETGAFERLVRFPLTETEITGAKAAAARRLSQDLRLKGFRPGKAPLPVVEAAVGSERLRSEAIDDLIPTRLTEVLGAEGIEPAITPRLEGITESDDGVEIEVLVTLWPTVDPPWYRGREVTVPSPHVTGAELDEQVRRMLEQFATVEEVDRPAEDGDFVSVDVEAWRDGELVEQAQASDLLYEVGSELFIDGIDSRLVGAGSGTVLEFEGPLPSGFGELAGTEVTFKITVNEVKQRVLPGLDDHWVAENTEFETVEELRKELRERIGEVKRRTASREFAERALSTLVDEVDVVLPESLVRAEMDDLLHRFLHRLEDSELTLEDYLRATGIDQETLIDDLRRQADRSLRSQLVIEAVVRAEGLEVTAEEVSGVVQTLAARSGDPVAYLKAFQKSGQELALAGDILRNRALDLILESARAVDEEGNPVSVKEVEAEVVTEVLTPESMEEE